MIEGPEKVMQDLRGWASPGPGTVVVEDPRTSLLCRHLGCKLRRSRVSGRVSVVFRMAS